MSSGHPQGQVRARAPPGGQHLLCVYPQPVQRPRPSSLVSSYKGANPVRGGPALMTFQRPHPQMPSHRGSLSRYKFQGDTSIRSAAAAAPGAVSGLPLETPRDPREAERVSLARRGEVGATQVWVGTRGAGEPSRPPSLTAAGLRAGTFGHGPLGGHLTARELPPRSRTPPHAAQSDDWWMRTCKGPATQPCEGLSNGLLKLQSCLMVGRSGLLTTSPQHNTLFPSSSSSPSHLLS